MEYISARIIERSERYRGGGRVEPATAFVSGSRNQHLRPKKKGRAKCWDCGNPNHKRGSPDCPKGKSFETGGLDSKGGKARGSKAYTVKADSRTVTFDDDSDVASFATAYSVKGNEDSYILDSGASHHITSLEPLGYQPFTSPRKVFTAAKGHVMVAVGSGTINLGSIVLENVWFVPDVKEHLVSLSQLVMEGWEAQLSRSGGKLVRDGTVVPVALENGIWTLSAGPKYSSASRAHHAKTLEEWHIILGHPSKDRILQAAREGLMEGLDMSVISDPKSEIICDDCLRVKSTVLPLPKKATRRCSRPLELIHSDLSGRKLPSRMGNRYYITFVDDYSRYVWIDFIREKSDAFSAFKKWKRYAENQFNQRVGTLRTDGGGEYHSKDFNNYLESHGIVRYKVYPLLLKS